MGRGSNTRNPYSAPVRTGLVRLGDVLPLLLERLCQAEEMGAEPDTGNRAVPVDPVTLGAQRQSTFAWYPLH